jgi:tRNA A-37 threonylcarbamoyl transferase component Bud32
MTSLTKEYRETTWSGLFDAASLGDFESLWHKDLSIVEAGNVRGKGWSNVCTLELSDTKFYVKRQSNYFTRAPSSFFRKTPVVNVEFEKIKHFQRLGIPTLEVAYFGMRMQHGDMQAILVTRSLDDYKPLDVFLANGLAFDLLSRLNKEVGRAVALMHEAGQLHANLSPKHLFVKQIENEEFEVRFIDLESSRSHFGQRALKIRDLEKLNRTVRNVSRSGKLRTLLAYAGKSRVDKALRCDIAYIEKRTASKKQH